MVMKLLLTGCSCVPLNFPGSWPPPQCPHSWLQDAGLRLMAELRLRCLSPDSIRCLAHTHAQTNMCTRCCRWRAGHIVPAMCLHTTACVATRCASSTFDQHVCMLYGCRLLAPLDLLKQLTSERQASSCCSQSRT